MIATKGSEKKIKVLDDGDRIYLYKRGSAGEVVGVYESIMDIVKLEKPFNKKFSYAFVYQSLVGKKRSFASFYHGCRVRAVVKKVGQCK